CSTTNNDIVGLPQYDWWAHPKDSNDERTDPSRSRHEGAPPLYAAPDVNEFPARVSGRDERAFGSGRRDNCDRWTMNADGSHGRQISSNCGPRTPTDASAPAFDERRIAPDSGTGSDNLTPTRGGLPPRLRGRLLTGVVVPKRANMRPFRCR